MRLIELAMVAALGIVMFDAHGQTDQQRLGEILSKPIRVERRESVTEVPLTLKSGKLYLEATIEEIEAEFVFDTGSPTLLDKSFAKQLDLTIIGVNTGRDANGKEVSMTIAVASTIEIGDTVFYDVPVMIHDFANIPLGHCYIPNGVLGSELLPGSAWRLDTAAATLQIAANSDRLPTLKNTRSAPLHIFGYPFAPIIDYSIGKFSDKALFDTGNAASLALFQNIARDRAVRKKIDEDSVREGLGRLGTSAGGVGEVVPLRRFQLSDLRIGENDMGAMPTQLKPIPPTLVGAGLLRSHTVTLDYPNAQFTMSAIDRVETPKLHPGLALMVQGDGVEVSQLFNDSRAQKAGVLLGDRVNSVNGRPLAVATEAERCDTSLWLSNTLDADSLRTLTISRDGEQLVLDLMREE